MTKSTLILGPPGCGKTYTLMGVVQESLSRGVSPWEIGFLSFTRKAVQEAAGRAANEFGFQSKDTPYFKTLHALGFHLLGLKKEDVMSPADWKTFADELGMEIKGEKSDPGDLSAAINMGSGEGDRYLRVLERAAMRQISIEQEYRETEQYDLSFPMLKKVEELLNIYRQQLHKVTFVDMLRMFVQFGEAPRLRVLIIDEAQDLAPLQWAVVDKLVANAEEVYFAGDDDQAIHRWAGVEVQQFLDASPNIKVLTQSYRLPRSVFNLSQRVVHRIRDRVPKDYHPMSKEGKVIFEPSKDFLDLTQGSWTLMTRVNYMAHEWGDSLREDGFMFSINGRRSIRETLTDSIDLWRRLQAGGSIYAGEMKSLYSQTAAGVLERGAKKLIEAADSQAAYTIADLQQNFGLKAGDNADALSVIRMNESEKAYIQALERRGEDVTQEPRIKIGTIHSNKGGEDDNVAVDLGSTRAAVESRFPDDEHRVFYVGFTRAKNNLHVIQSDKRNRYDV